LRISVREITPVKRPDNPAPGRAAAETVVGNVPLIEGEAGFEFDVVARTAWEREGVARGVTGFDGAGEADSTTQTRCDRVATSLATVWARVEPGFTWNTVDISMWPCPKRREHTWERILAITNSSFSEDDRNEMNAGVAYQR